MNSIYKKVVSFAGYVKKHPLKTALYLLPSFFVFYSVYLAAGFCSGIVKIIFIASSFLVKTGLFIFVKLVIHTLQYIYIPLLLYLSVCLFVKKKFTRVYLFTVLFSVYLVLFFEVVLPSGFDIPGNLFRIHKIIIALIQIYIFAALIIPYWMSTVLASLFFVVKSLLVFILPDLPTRFDDFGIILALFIFTFLYLNTIVYLSKAAGKFLVKTDVSASFQNIRRLN